MEGVPQVLSMREMRSELTGLVKRVAEPGAAPVFVGSHRKAEAVLMSIEQYEQLYQLAEARRDAVAEALASVRAEGLEPSPEGLDRLDAVAEGRMSLDEAVAQALAPYRR
jgi:prevent-host-death family protein